MTDSISSRDAISETNPSANMLKLILFNFGCLAVFSMPSDVTGESRLEIHEVVTREINIFEAGIYMFQLDIGRFPSTEEGLGSIFYQLPNMPGWRCPYINAERLDVWNTEYVYLYPAKYGNKDFDLYSFGKNRIDNFGTEDDISNWGGFNPQYYNPKKWRRLKLYLSLIVLTTLMFWFASIIWRKRRNKPKINLGLQQHFQDKSLSH